MKYRIVEHRTNGVVKFYVPQYKKFLFWMNWDECTCMDCYGRVSRRKYEDALAYINKHIESRASRSSCIIHNIV